MKMVSELAANAWRHALRGKDLDEAHAPIAGRSEITIYRRGQRTNAEIVVTVFDPDPRLDTVPRVTNHTILAEITHLRLTETLPPADLDARLLSQLEERRNGLDVVWALEDLGPDSWSLRATRRSPARRRDQTRSVARTAS